MQVFNHPDDGASDPVHVFRLKALRTELGLPDVYAHVQAPRAQPAAMRETFGFCNLPSHTAPTPQGPSDEDKFHALLDLELDLAALESSEVEEGLPVPPPRAAEPLMQPQQPLRAAHPLMQP